MRRPSAVRALIFAIAGVVSGCATGTARTTVERVGGAERTRPFASATAYEAYLRAEIAAQRGDSRLAARQLELAEVGDPADDYLPARRAELLLASGDTDGALSVAREATGRFPHSAASWLALGEVLGARGDHAGAAQAFTHAMESAPDDPEVRSAVARAQGAGTNSVANAIATAPDARAGDHTVSERMLLADDPASRATLSMARRERARRAWERHAYADVDAVLTPIVLADPHDVNDRVRVIEARALDGRPGDAARLVAGVPVGAGGVSAAEHARLWLLAGHPEIAAEEADHAVQSDAHDAAAREVLGESLVRADEPGRVARGVSLLAEVGPDSPRFVDARIAAAQGIARQARPEVADAVLARAVGEVSRDDAPGRDRLRLARAELLLGRGASAEANAVVAAVESPWGRQRRGVLWASSASPDAVLADLRVRTGDNAVDALADAQIALVCFVHPTACHSGEREHALTAAQQGAPSAADTLRAMATAAPDRREALDLLHRAALRDPFSPWNATLSRQLGSAR